MIQESLLAYEPKKVPSLTRADKKYLKRIHEFMEKQGWHEHTSKTVRLFSNILLLGDRDSNFKSMAGIISILTILRSEGLGIRFNVLVKDWYAYLERDPPKRLLKLRYRVQHIIAPNGIPKLSAVDLFERVFKTLLERTRGASDREYIEHLQPRAAALITHYQLQWSGQGRTAHSLISAAVQASDPEKRFAFDTPLFRTYCSIIRPEGQSRTRYHYALQDLLALMQDEYDTLLK